MTGERYRLVYKSARELHLSPVVFTEDEIEDYLEIATNLYEATGWTVTRGELLLVCRRGDSLRTIQAKSFGPFDDTTETRG